MNGVVVEETFRRFVSNPFYLVFVLFMTLIAAIAANFEEPAFLWTSMLFVLVVAAGGSLIGPEFSSGTLQLVLTKPVSRSSYLLSRYAGAVLAVWAAAGWLTAVEILIRAGWRGGAGIPMTAVAGLNVGAGALIVCALLAFFGTLLRAYFNVGLYLIGTIVLSFLPPALGSFSRIRSGVFAGLAGFVADHPEIIRAIHWIERNLYPERPRSLDAGWLLLVASNAAIFLVLACLTLRRREVPYGAD